MYVEHCIAISWLLFTVCVQCSNLQWNYVTVHPRVRVRHWKVSVSLPDISVCVQRTDQAGEGLWGRPHGAGGEQVWPSVPDGGHQAGSGLSAQLRHPFYWDFSQNQTGESHTLLDTPSKLRYIWTSLSVAKLAQYSHQSIPFYRRFQIGKRLLVVSRVLAEWTRQPLK